MALFNQVVLTEEIKIQPGKLSSKGFYLGLLGISLLAMLVLGIFSPLCAEEPDSSLAVRQTAIPYPNRGIYISKGLAGSVGIGLSAAEGDFYRGMSLFQWQGEGSFYYKPWISGGASAKILAGEPSDSSTQVENRYLIFVRLHKALSRAAAFSGFSVGLFNLEFSEDSSDNAKWTRYGGSVERALLEYALEIGSGWMFLPPLGLSVGLQAEQVAGQDFFKNIFSHGKFRYNESLVRVSAGLNFDLLYIWKDMAKLSKGGFLVFEFQYAVIDDNEYPERRRELAYMGGCSIAF